MMYLLEDQCRLLFTCPQQVSHFSSMTCLFIHDETFLTTPRFVDIRPDRQAQEILLLLLVACWKCALDQPKQLTTRLSC
jgi:hypothetical protein